MAGLRLLPWLMLDLREGSSDCIDCGYKRRVLVHMCIYICIYVYSYLFTIHIFIYVYIHVYIPTQALCCLPIALISDGAQELCRLRLARLLVPAHWPRLA